MTWPTRRRPSGHAEFTRIYLSSLTRSIEREVVSHRNYNRRLRLALAERRLRKIDAASFARGLHGEKPGRNRPRVALFVATVAVLCSLVILGTSIAADGPAVMVALSEVAMLALVVIWFVLAVACVPKIGEPE
ncbi:MAG: hypothetical protein ACRDM1_00815 [Gaiellaceae bacterium]